MPWTDWVYQAGPIGGPYLNLDDYMDGVVIPSEGDAPKRGSGVVIPYRDGVHSDPFKFRDAQTMMLSGLIRYTNNLGLVTHVDGAAGHVMENLQTMKTLMGGNGNFVNIRRTAPHMGAVETLCEHLGGLRAAGPRMKFVWALQMVDAMWRDQALSSDTATSIAVFPHAFTMNTGGDAPIGDAKITFTCVANGNSPSLEIDSTGDKVSVSGSFVASDVIVVDLGRPRTLTLNGARYGSISPNRGWWMRFPENDPTLGVTLDATSGTWTCLIEWRNKWQ